MMSSVSPRDSRERVALGSDNSRPRSCRRTSPHSARDGTHEAAEEVLRRARSTFATKPSATPVRSATQTVESKGAPDEESTEPARPTRNFSSGPRLPCRCRPTGSSSFRRTCVGEPAPVLVPLRPLYANHCMYSESFFSSCSVFQASHSSFVGASSEISLLCCSCTPPTRLVVCEACKPATRNHTSPSLQCNDPLLNKTPW
mmetsp:Transcript_75326/g.191100  ORF Transcript_75326/g.191100 Transcript_75326/m.191100 type:complete len:201 (+) Transcript_75326:58-660(+)